MSPFDCSDELFITYFREINLKKTSLKEIALLFLKLGITAFGGPAVHIAMMEEEAVSKKKWLMPNKFLDLLGSANIIPGPSSTELAIYIGYGQAGWQGLIIAGLCFILPAVIIVAIIAKLYVAYGSLPQFTGILYGVKPVIIAIILKAIWHLGKIAFKNRLLILIAALAAILNFIGLNGLVVLFGAGILMVLKEWLQQKPHNFKMFTFLQLNVMTQVTINAGNTIPFGLWPFVFSIFKSWGCALW